MFCFSNSSINQKARAFGVARLPAHFFTKQQTQKIWPPNKLTAIKTFQLTQNKCFEEYGSVYETLEKTRKQLYIKIRDPFPPISTPGAGRGGDTRDGGCKDATWQKHMKLTDIWLCKVSFFSDVSASAVSCVSDMPKHSTKLHWNLNRWNLSSSPTSLYLHLSFLIKASNTSLL